MTLFCQFVHRLIIQLCVFLDHGPFEDLKIVNHEKHLEKFFIVRNRQPNNHSLGELFLGDHEFVHFFLQKNLAKFDKVFVDFKMIEWVFLFILERDAVLLHVSFNWDSPHWRVKELYEIFCQPELQESEK